MVTQYGVDGIAGHTTWRVALHVDGSSDALNVYTIYGDAGTVDHPLEIPAAHQVAAPFGQDVGGINPAFFAEGVSPESEYDSWVTVGLTTGNSGELGSVGISWEAWQEDSGLLITDGAVFWMNPANGPTTADKDPIVMQLTVPSGCSFHGVFNAQGHTRPGSIDGSWDARNIQFHGGPNGECQQARAPPPPPSTTTPPPPPQTRPITTPPPPPPDSSSGYVVVVVLVAIGAGVAVAKKKQEGGGSNPPEDGGIYAKEVVSSMRASPTLHFSL